MTSTISSVSAAGQKKKLYGAPAAASPAGVVSAPPPSTIADASVGAVASFNAAAKARKRAAAGATLLTGVSQTAKPAATFKPLTLLGY